MNISETIAKGFALITEGRSAITSVIDAVKDGTAVLAPGQTIESLQAQLEREEEETKVAFSDARAAIASFRAGGK